MYVFGSSRTGSVSTSSQASVPAKLTVCAIPAFRERLVVIGGGMGVHELPGVVGVVTRIL